MKDVKRTSAHTRSRSFSTSWRARLSRYCQAQSSISNMRLSSSCCQHYNCMGTRYDTHPPRERHRTLARRALANIGNPHNTLVSQPTQRGGTRSAPASSRICKGLSVPDPEPTKPSRATPPQPDLGPPSSQVQFTRRTHAATRRFQTQPINKFAGGKFHLGHTSAV
jgi:hypothetical protein